MAMKISQNLYSVLAVIVSLCTLFVEQSLETFVVSSSGSPVGASSRTEPYIASISPVSLIPGGYYAIQDGRYQHQYAVPPIMSAQFVRYPTSSSSGTMSIAPFARYASVGGMPSSSGTASYWAPQTSMVPPFTVGRYCDQQIVIEPKYQQCRTDALINWRSSSDMHNYYSTEDPVKTCCLFWATLDCTEDSIKRRCDQTSLHYFRVHRDELRNSLESKSTGICHEYHYGAFRCRIQSWILVIAISVLILFILLVIGGATWILLARKRKGSASSLATSRHTETLKRYSTSRDRPSPPTVVSQSSPPQRYQQSITTRSVVGMVCSSASSILQFNLDMTPTCMSALHGTMHLASSA